jgi:3-phenylpropionate/cinnamic acid dioxygenase small subunit
VYTPQQLSDRAEITDVVIRYAWAIDTKDWDLLDTCFMPDAYLDYSSNPGGKAGAYPEIRAWLARMMSAFPVTQHLMANTEVVLDGDRATARTMVTNPQGAATREGPLHFFYVGGRYDDEFVRTPDGWRIARRVETLLWFAGSLPPELIFPDDKRPQ